MFELNLQTVWSDFIKQEFSLPIKQKYVKNTNIFDVCNLKHTQFDDSHSNLM